MGNTGTLTFRPRTKVVVLREDFFDICGGNHAAALVLGQMYHWHQVKVDGMDDAITHNELAVKAGDSPAQRTDLWVYKQQAEIHAELLKMVGERAIGPAFAFLVERGFLQTRENPFSKWDKRKQYRFRNSAVQTAINALPPSRDTEKLTRRIADTETQFRAFGAALARDRSDAVAASYTCVDAGASSETTSETTNKEFPAKDSTAADGSGPPRSAKAEGPKTRGAEGPKTGNAGQQFIDAFTAKRGKAPNLVSKHHAQLKRYRDGVGEAVYLESLAGFFVSWLGGQNGFAVDTLLSKGVDTWMAATDEFRAKNPSEVVAPPSAAPAVSVRVPVTRSDADTFNPNTLMGRVMIEARARRDAARQPAAIGAA